MVYQLLNDGYSLLDTGVILANVINNGSACSVLFLSTTGLFSACVSCSDIFYVLETILECSKTVLNTPKHYLLHSSNSHILSQSVDDNVLDVD